MLIKINAGGEVLFSSIVKADLWYWWLLSMRHSLCKVENIAMIAREKYLFFLPFKCFIRRILPNLDKNTLICLEVFGKIKIIESTRKYIDNYREN